MNEEAQRSPLHTAARICLGILGFVAAVVQLTSAPWSIEVRIAIFAGLLEVGLLVVAYHLGLQRGASTKASTQPEPTEEPPLTSWWTEEDLIGAQFVKVAAQGNVFLCTLRSNRVVEEALLPRSANDAHQFSESWPGSWFFNANGLSIVVGGHHLMLQPSLKGTWTGLEYFGHESQAFIGAMVDPDPIGAGCSWVGLKLGMTHAEQRLIVAGADGRYRETDLYEAGKAREDKWRFDGGVLRLDIDGSTHPVEPFRPGIMLAMHGHPREGQEFALVRVREAP